MPPPSRAIFCLFAAITALAVTSRHTGASEPTVAIAATVCEIRAHPEKFADRRVRVRGRIDGNGLDVVFIGDDRCPAVAIALKASPSVAGKAAVRRVTGGIDENRYLDAAHKHRFSGVVEGIYRWNTEWRPMHQLQVQDVFDVSDADQTVLEDAIVADDPIRPKYGSGIIAVCATIHVRTKQDEIYSVYLIYGGKGQFIPKMGAKCRIAFHKRKFCEDTFGTSADKAEARTDAARLLDDISCSH